MVKAGDQIILFRILRSLVCKDSSSNRLLKQVSEKLAVQYAVYGNEKWLLGVPSESHCEFFLKEGDIHYGSLFSQSDNAKILADLIMFPDGKIVGLGENGGQNLQFHGTFKFCQTLSEN